MGDLSVVVMTWNRGGQRVTNLLASLLRHQNTPAVEVVLVDTSNDENIAQDIACRVRAFQKARLVRRPREGIYKSWALNVGIQATSPYSRWVMTTDIDFMFGARLIETVRDTLAKRATLLLCQPMRLPKGADLSDPFSSTEQWVDLCLSSSWWGPSGGPGAVQVLQRGQWFKLRGYDERFADGLGGMDGNLMQRVASTGAHVICIPFDVGQPLHQWHERSPHKEKLNYLLDEDAPLIANPDGWGDL